MCSQVTFVTFTVTHGSLQSWCLNQILKVEQPDVDTKSSDLLQLQGNTSAYFGSQTAFCSLVPRLFLPPVFDRLQMQKRRGKVWEKESCA